ncbi:hypothetical protein SEUCBS139899_001198 [Sporothrix eucalyptigena]|uniref:Uncharacterized protein n=1 Tax=Sporothrix eucalyptigena TaxID=1812306 RepID=A0ABP0BRQ2_9PEZI
MGGGPKIPYPKHVWSPAGGWYAQPANWKRNTAIAGLAVFGIVALVWKIDSELDWSRQIIEYEKAQKAQQEGQSESK